MNGHFFFCCCCRNMLENGDRRVRKRRRPHFARTKTRPVPSNKPKSRPLRFERSKISCLAILDLLMRWTSSHRQKSLTMPHLAGEILNLSNFFSYSVFVISIGHLTHGAGLPLFSATMRTSSDVSGRNHRTGPSDLTNDLLSQY
jgi:hypothetical protein